MDINIEAENVLDIEELKNLQKIAVRPNVKDLLAAEITKLTSNSCSTSREEVKDSNYKPATPAVTSQDTTTTTSTQNFVGVKTAIAPPKYYKDITNYAWDQSDKFMKIYVTVNGVQNLSKESITTEFTNKTFRLRVENLDNKNYQCHVAFLWDNIVPSESYHKVKTDCVLLMLKKSEERKTWAYVTQKDDDKKKKKGPKFDDKKDPNEGLMDMLKKMYEEGDEDMKRTISKSFAESRSKKGAAGDSDFL